MAIFNSKLLNYQRVMGYDWLGTQELGFTVIWTIWDGDRESGDMTSQWNFRWMFDWVQRAEIWTNNFGISWDIHVIYNQLDMILRFERAIYQQDCICNVQKGDKPQEFGDTPCWEPKDSKDTDTLFTILGADITLNFLFNKLIRWNCKQWNVTGREPPCSKWMTTNIPIDRA